MKQISYVRKSQLLRPGNSCYIAEANNQLVRIFELDKKVLRMMAIEE
jgi:hypothetical protein